LKDEGFTMLTKNRRRSAIPSPSSAPAAYSRRRGTHRNPQLSRPDYPFAMAIPDGRTMVVAVPGRWTAEDRDGSTLLLPEAVRFLDRVQALVTPRKATVTPGYIVALREALNMTQTEFAKEVGVAKMTVSRWERGELRPGDESLTKIEKLRATRLAQGVVLPA
jgi:DNA-binding transcriptional regulator YiaG